MTTGLLLLNLGTPSEPTAPAVRRYLRDFLSDPRVLDIHPIGRALLLNLIILPTRPAKSAHAYRQIWDADRGSPLLWHSQDLAAGVQAQLGTSWRVVLAMRYGQPSIAAALDAMTDCERIVVLPLFPQHAASSSSTAVARVMELAGAKWDVPALEIVPAFFSEPRFLDAWVAVAAPALLAAKADHILFSFHGLPERHIRKSGDERCLAQASCCDRILPTCYRSQCFATARSLAERMKLSQYTVCFQSRLGRTPWITPHTDVVIDELAASGVKRLAVMCPAFVADCLETLEEIGIRARQQFKAAGGEELVLIPSLNATPLWIDAVCAIAERHRVAEGAH